MAKKQPYKYSTLLLSFNRNQQCIHQYCREAAACNLCFSNFSFFVFHLLVNV